MTNVSVEIELKNYASGDEKLKTTGVQITVDL